jgi:hypothetical protein
MEEDDLKLYKKAGRYYVETPPKGTSWLFLTGATEKSQEELIELAQSWYYPAKVLTGYEHNKSIPGMAQGPVLYEGFAFSERAYTFRKFGEDKVNFIMYPRKPVINPVLHINGWKSPNATVKVNNKALGSNKYVHAISGNDLILIVMDRFTAETSFEISG